MSAPLFLAGCDASMPRRTADIPRIGFLSPFSAGDPVLDSALDDFRQGLGGPRTSAAPVLAVELIGLPGDFGYREGDTTERSAS